MVTKKLEEEIHNKAVEVLILQEEIQEKARRLRLLRREITDLAIARAAEVKRMNDNDPFIWPEW